MFSEPVVLSTQISQFLHGHSADVIEWAHDIECAPDWRRVRGSDGYEGWVHAAYFEARPANGPIRSGWESENLLSMGTTVRDSNDLRRRLPLGAIIEPGEEVESGTALTLPERRARFPRNADSLVATAIELFEGTYYQWGGVTPWGCDCSGLVQTSMALHGVPMLRDAALQATQGVEVEGGLEGVRTGDLIFFSSRDDGIITHVGLSLGGSRMVHLTLYQGGHSVDDLSGNSDRMRTLRGRFRFARRIL